MQTNDSCAMKLVFAFAPFFALAACGITPATPTLPPVPDPAQDTCNAASFASLVGQDATALERVLLLGEVRIIRPGQAVTMDFRPSRINFNIGPDNRITAITCS